MPTKHKLISAVILLSLIMAPGVLAQNMNSDNYRIRFGNFNMTSGRKTSASYSLTDTVGQTAAGEFTSSGYTVKAGFQYIYTLYDFSFTISDLSIDFGSLTPDSFSTQSNTLTVSAPGQGYTITAIEDHPLEKGADQIPDTACGATPCTISSAELWTDTSYYGFGYNMTGNDIPADFSSSSHFRPFADNSNGDSPQTVMSSSSAGQNRVSTVTYKVNVSGSQAAGDYENQITFIATPTY